MSQMGCANFDAKSVHITTIIRLVGRSGFVRLSELCLKEFVFVVILDVML